MKNKGGKLMGKQSMIVFKNDSIIFGVQDQKDSVEELKIKIKADIADCMDQMEEAVDESDESYYLGRIQSLRHVLKTINELWSDEDGR